MTGYGSLAQLGEHLPYKQRVSGSSPLTSTKKALTKVSAFSFSLLQPGSSSANRQRVTGSSPLTSTKQEKSEPFTKRWWVRIYCFHGKKWKAGDKNREDCWLRQSSWFFMQMHCLRLRFLLSDWQTPLLCYPPHFVFTLCDRCGIAAVIVNSFYCRYKAACIDWYNQLYCMST